MREPLAILMRPTKLNDIIGQEHLVGKDGLIRNFIKNKRIPLVILYNLIGVFLTSQLLKIIFGMAIFFIVSFSNIKTWIKSARRRPSLIS